jgi:glycine/D-amino acid oxidase-like deaminating enzyme
LVLPYRSQVLAANPPLDADGAVRRVLPQVTWSRRGWDYAQQAADGTLVVGGEQLEQVERLRHWTEAAEPTDQAWLESWIRRVLGIEPDVVARWAGVLSQTPDGFAYLGPLPERPRVVTCGGWGGAGNVLGFVGGRLVADLVHSDVDAIPRELHAARLAD